MNDIPICECATAWPGQGHHPECPVRREIERLRELEKRSNSHSAAEDYYRTELSKAHTLLGRVVHQLSERWDTINLTEYFPTSNLHHKRSVSNPAGK